jgi:outer membrane murein-binding lipoprotein Lpp
MACAVLGCGHSQKAYAATQSPLALSRVVLYRNGVGYFERHGVVDGDKLTLKVRKDQVNDLLKSLTVIDRNSGKALSVSIPLDPQAWQDAALSLLMPGRGRLPEVLDGLRGVHISVETASRQVHGRIVMVERMNPEPGPMPLREPQPQYEDHKLTLLDGDALQIVRVSQIRTITLEEGDLVMQLDRHLDATSGEGMFQQVSVVVRLTDQGKHDLAVSYVAAAPLWKPTYRVVLASDGSGKALLQAWAVVSNVSGESWDKVALGLTSGAPLAFRYDLHTPENVERPDLTQSGVHKQAQVAFGESTYAQPPMAAAAPMPASEPMAADLAEEEMKGNASMAPAAVGGGGPMAQRLRGLSAKKAMPMQAPRPVAPAVDMAALARSVAPRATAKQVAGLTRFDITDPVTLPDGSASMVALVNQLVPGEQTFLFKPGGSGQGYEQNPYRVVRFKNDTDFVLEPGPISIYAGGSFVGEGLSEAIASHDMATIPFAAEPSVLVRSTTESSGDAMKITKIVHGVMQVDAFHRVTTTWSVQGPATDTGFRVLARQSRAGDNYTLVDPPKDTETLSDGYFIPVVVAPKQTAATLAVIEQTPSQTSLTIWDDHAPELLKQLLETPGLDAKSRAALEPIVQARQEIGRIDTQLQGLSAQQEQLDQRANEERENLTAIQKDPRASALRKRLTQRLDELSKQAEEIGRKLVELNSQRLERKIELEDKLRDLDLSALAR